MMKMKEVQEFSAGLIHKEEDIGNSAMMNGIHDMVDMNWAMENKAWWIVEQISSDPYDSLKDAVDLLGKNNPHLKMTPYGDLPEDKEQAEAIEQALMWELSRTLMRRGASNKKATLQAFKNGRIGAQLIYLPWQIKALQTLGKDTRREEMALERGKFLLNVHDARNVFPYWTDYGLEGVLVKSIKPVQEVIDFWGDKNTAKLKRHVDENNFEWATQFDYWDLDQRSVWVVPHKKGMYAKANEEGYPVLEKDLDIPFLPWIVSDLGDPLRPLLYSVWKSGQWDLMNVYLSAQSSEVRAYIAAPRLKFEGPNPSSIKADYGDPNRPLEVPPGHQVTEMQPPGLDPALSEMIGRLQGMVSKSTIAHNVQTADFGSGAAYASIRELIDLTSRRLNDGKAILENYYRDVFIKMLRWIDYQEDSITAYLDDEYGTAQQIKLVSPNAFEDVGYTFDVDNLDFQVDMTADIPEDQVARHNAATLFTQLGGSKEKAMETLGISNPSKEIERARLEAIEDAQVQAQVALIQGQVEIQLQQMAMQMQAQQQMQQQQVPPQVANAPQNPQTQALQGQGFNPAMGGTATDRGAPGISSPARRDNPPQVRPPGG